MATICTVTEVTCSTARELISARIDGELDAADETQLDSHLQSCVSCLEYQEDAFALRRALRMRVVEPEPAANVSVDLAGSLQGVSILRWALFVIGGTLVVLNLSPIISPDGGAGAHLDRHDGVFGMALGIGMLAVAAKPHRAIGLVPLTSAIALLMTIVAIADLVTGNANLLAEAVHVVQFAGLICLWVISGGPSRVPKHLEAISRRLPAFHGR
jgi:predicted anti-sigma-YlaC factor YlaD